MKLVFSSFVFGSYQKYIPYYIYSIWKTQPNCFVKIFIESSLESNIYETLEYLKRIKIDNFEIVILEDCFEEYKVHKMKGGGVRTLIRYLIGREGFNHFDYVYIGDIDILFLPEEQSILDFHIKQLTKLDLPFSNKVRLDKNGELTERLTGLHFFKTKEYLEKINPIITRIKKDKIYRDNYLVGLERDENFLYKINKEAFDFDPKLVSTAQRPWHGLHLGITRGNKDLDIETIEENSSLSLIEVKNYLRKYIKDPVFKKIQSKVFVIELEAILRELSIPYSLSWRFKGFKYRMRVQWRSTKRKIKGYLK